MKPGADGQDFEFNVASSRVRITADGNHVLATGIYAPETRKSLRRELKGRRGPRKTARAWAKASKLVWLGG